jgi:hypothetical protein
VPGNGPDGLLQPSRPADHLVLGVQLGRERGLEDAAVLVQDAEVGVPGPAGELLHAGVVVLALGDLLLDALSFSDSGAGGRAEKRM